MGSLQLLARRSKATHLPAMPMQTPLQNCSSWEEEQYNDINKP